MTHCDDFIDRLYDEDCRRALRVGLQPPSDVRPHVARCASCKELWSGARGDSAWLTAALTEEPAADVEQRALEAMGKALPPRPEPLVDWTAPTLWAACGAAVAGSFVLLIGAVVPQGWTPVIVIGVGAASFALELTLQGLDATTP